MAHYFIPEAWQIFWLGIYCPCESTSIIDTSLHTGTDWIFLSMIYISFTYFAITWNTLFHAIPFSNHAITLVLICLYQVLDIVRMSAAIMDVDLTVIFIFTK